MHILLCAATEFEIAATKQFLETSSPKNFTINFFITGIGLLPTTYNLVKYLSAHQPNLIIQAGIGGAVDESIRLGETLVISSDCLGDSGVEENSQFKSLFELNLTNPDTYPWQGGKLVNPYALLLAKTSLPSAEGITVHEISTNKKRIDYYKERWNAQVESLEGAALHYVALKEKIPFLQIRTISNYIGERNKNKWELNMAINNLNKEIQRILPVIDTSII